MASESEWKQHEKGKKIRLLRSAQFFGQTVGPSSFIKAQPLCQPICLGSVGGKRRERKRETALWATKLQHPTLNTMSTRFDLIN